MQNSLLVVFSFIGSCLSLVAVQRDSSGKPTVHRSRERRVVVSLVQRGDGLRIQVRDWGVGFDPHEVPENRFGLEGIRERARLLGGRCRIRSSPGRGTSVLVELPVTELHAGTPRRA